jgi:hypothetical protein
LPTPKLSDAEFIALWRKLGTTGMVKEGHGDYSNIGKRRRRIERRHRISLVAPHHPEHYPQVSEHPGWVKLTIKNGMAVVGGDAHIWPGPMTTAMRAFLQFIKREKPTAVILNGDVVDLAAISRHARIGWSHEPMPADEIEAAQEQLHAIATAAGKARKIWPLGNHDARLETSIANRHPKLEKLQGTRLRDFFPLWEPCWACQINDDVVIRHKPNKGGVHSAYNSTIHAGTTVVHNHLHRQQVRGFSDYRGTRWGVDTGCLADPRAEAFLAYTEAAPLDWRSGFAVLTFRDGKLMQPELVSVFGDEVHWRGQLIEV